VSLYVRGIEIAIPACDTFGDTFGWRFVQ
jgi:hypothetical protein